MTLGLGCLSPWRKAATGRILGAATVGYRMEVPQQHKSRTLHVPAIPLLDWYTKGLKAGTQNGYFHPHVHSSSIHNSQKGETTQVYIANAWINKMWYIHAMKYHSSIK